MQKNQKSLPRLSYTASHPIYLVWFWFLYVFSIDFCIGPLSWGLLLQLSVWQMVCQVGASPVQCLFPVHCDAPSLLWFSLTCSSLFPSWQFYFHLTTPILLVHHIKISVSSGNLQSSQLPDCSELSFVALSFFSSL